MDTQLWHAMMWYENYFLFFTLFIGGASNLKAINSFIFSRSTFGEAFLTHDGKIIKHLVLYELTFVYS